MSTNFNTLNGAQLATLRVVGIMLPPGSVRCTPKAEPRSVGRPFTKDEATGAHAGAMRGQHRGAIRPGKHSGLPDTKVIAREVHEPREKRLGYGWM